MVRRRMVLGVRREPERSRVSKEGSARIFRVLKLCVVVLAVTFVLVPAAEAKRDCQSHRCEKRVASKKCSQQNPRACIRHAILRYRLKPWQAAWMYRVARCESGMRPGAKNPGSSASGLYQHLYPSTWNTTPWRRHSPFQARYSALAAAWMVKRGRAREWICQ